MRDYLRRIEALEEAIGVDACPVEGRCGKCVALAVLAVVRNQPQVECDGAPGTTADGLAAYTHQELHRAVKILSEWKAAHEASAS
jgi:hypothetical protein